MASARIGGAATASASSTASQLAVVSMLCPAPAMSRAASAAAFSGLPSASPINGTLLVLWPADCRLPAIPLAPFSTSRPAAPIVDIAWCTASPIHTQSTAQPMTTMSLMSWKANRCGLLA
jgi:hypothetical protein